MTSVDMLIPISGVGGVAYTRILVRQTHACTDREKGATLNAYHNFMVGA